MRAVAVDLQDAKLETCPLSMRGRTKLNTNEAAVEYVPKSLTTALEFDIIFPRFAPVEIDLGCGDGTFLTVMARENPEHNFLGIERLLGRVRSVCRKIARLDLKNARVLRMESSYAVTNLLPAGSVTAFHLLFPDPWPKRRHHRRRAFTHEFLFSIHRALVAGGLFHVATDHTDYFQQIEKVIAEADTFALSREQNNFPHTTFERKFIARGLPVHRLLLRKFRRLSKPALSILHRQIEPRLHRSGPGGKV
jgi:tRNA (guanine-N7-)-methyltransferase